MKLPTGPGSMKAQSAKWVAVVLGSAAVLDAWRRPRPGDTRRTLGGVSITRYELLVGIAHGNTLMSTVLLVGLPMFAALIWLPTSRAFGVGRDSAHLFSRCAWALFGLLLVAGLAEVARTRCAISTSLSVWGSSCRHCLVHEWGTSGSCGGGSPAGHCPDGVLGSP